MYVNPVLILTLSIIITFAVLLYFLSPKITLQNIGPAGIFSITSVNPINDINATTILNSSKYTLAFFINPSLLNQQITNNPNSASTQYIPVVNFQSAWSLDFSGAPDAASNNASYIQLTVYQKQYLNAPSPISKPLQQIPLQKWTHVAIVRDSRRMTVYYNGVTVYSLIYDMPLASGSLLSFGNSSAYITGNFTNITLNSTVSNIEDIKSLYSSLSDITGLPHTASLHKFPSLSDLVSINYSLPVPSFQAAAPPPGSTWNSYYA